MALFYKSRKMHYGFVTILISLLFWILAVHLPAVAPPTPSQPVAAIVRHGSTLNAGRVEGSVRLLSGESFVLNGGAIVTGDLLAPGTPRVLVNGTPIYGGTLEGTGSTQPSGYPITLNSGCSLTHVITRTDPIGMDSVPVPPASTGTRDVIVNQPGQSVGDFASVRDLTLNSNVGIYDIPAGTYRRFTANGGGGFALGQAGSQVPAVYNFQELAFNGSSQLQARGLVIINVATHVTVNGTVTFGLSAHPDWVSLNIAQADLTISTGSSVYAFVRAPAGTVTIAGRLKGTLSANRLTINGGQLLFSPLNHPPSVEAGADQIITLPASAMLSGAVTDDGFPSGSSVTSTWTKTSGLGEVTFSNPNAIASTASFSLPGTYVLRLTASDTEKSAFDELTVVVNPPLPINQPPAVNAGPEQTITLPSSANLNGSATDDGLPAGSSLTYSWSKLSGPGIATFSAPLNAATTVSFSQAGDYQLQLAASDSQLAGAGTVMVHVLAANVPPTVTLAAPSSGATYTAPATVVLTASAADSDGSIDKVEFFSDGSKLGESSASPFSFNWTNVPAGSYSLTAIAIDNQGANATSAPVNITVNNLTSGLPPDPVSVAPPLDKTVATNLFDATQFLYTGENPIQTGVVPETFEIRRAAVLRGKVLKLDGTALSGVKISILNHPEFGQTLSRADGMFDLAVNGGGPLVIKYQKENYISIQRQVDTPWQDWRWAPDVVMVGYDSQVASIRMNSNTPVQVARGTLSSDKDGQRRATLLFPGATSATMTLPGGSSQPLNILHVRATEYTVGPNGPQAMPAQLPPQSAYTYCVELSADEAVSAGASSVELSQSVPFYLENFLNFPVGGSVPTGYYDQEKGLWIPVDSGRIVSVLSIENNQAILDISGQGMSATPEELAALGITGPERVQLAQLYSPGQSLWRVPIRHFSPYDLNWGVPPSRAPDQKPTPKVPDDKPCKNPGCIIDIQNQVLGESVRILGTPYSLHYQTDVATGGPGNNLVEINVSGNTTNVKRINVEIEVGGEKYQYIFDPLPDQKMDFQWDGKDAYGRVLQGRQKVVVKISYIYDGVYGDVLRFAYFGSGRIFTANSQRNEVAVTSSYSQDLFVGVLSNPANDLGGWSMDAQHRYDPVGKVLYLGNGSRRNAIKELNFIVKNMAGNGAIGYLRDGGPAIKAPLGKVGGCGGNNSKLRIATASDGSFYISDSGNNVVRKVNSTGIIGTVAGDGEPGFSGDGGAAIHARLNDPSAIAIGPDGSLYLGDDGNFRIRKIDPNGIITTFAGNGSAGFSGDGGAAILASLGSIESLAVGPDGSLYFGDGANYRIRRIDPSGQIATLAGTGEIGDSGDGGLAIAATISMPSSIAINQVGEVYFADSWSGRIRKIYLNGTIETVAGNGNYGLPELGAKANESPIGQPEALIFDRNGELLVGLKGGWLDGYLSPIIQIGQDGLIKYLAGNEPFNLYNLNDNILAAQARINADDLNIMPDGSILIADSQSARVRRLTQLLPGLDKNDYLIASENGKELYHFNWRGKHMRTLNALTQAVLQQFNYNEDGTLASITDAFGNVTQIERVQGEPSAIISPYGQRTSLVLNDKGLIASVTNPASETVFFEYNGPGNLLSKTKDARQQEYTYQYDAFGHLIREEDPSGGYQELTRSIINGSPAISVTTPLTTPSVYRTEELYGVVKKTNTSPDGSQIVTTEYLTGKQQTQFANGVVESSSEAPDPQNGMMAPYITELTTQTPGGLISLAGSSKSMTYSDPDNPLSIATITENTLINDRSYTTVYDAAAKSYTTTSYQGQTISMVDDFGRIRQSSMAGLAAVNYQYDSRGRLQSVTQGSGSEARTTTCSYNSQGWLESVTDPLQRTVQFQYDPAGRITKQLLPDQREISFVYDPNGNLVSLTPPSRPAHSFEFTPVNLTSKYSPPPISIGNTDTSYEYDLERRSKTISRPDGKIIQFGYNAAGKLETLTMPNGQIAYSYNQPGCGNCSGGDQPTKIEAPDETLAYTYDGNLRTSETWSGSILGSVVKGYNDDFLVRSLTVNGQPPIQYRYDNAGKLVGAGALTLSRDQQNGMLTGSQLGETYDSWQYNQFGEPSGYTASFNGAPLFSVIYTRDKLGRITDKTETIGAATDTYHYQYDLAGRLTGVVKNGVNIGHFEYGANSNRASYTSPDGTTTYSYDNQDRLLSFTKPGSQQPTVHSYTANGELQSKTEDGQTTTYEYDVLGQLRKVNLPDGTFVEYLIDGQNRRIAKKVNGILVQGFLYQNSLNPFAELDGGGNILSIFVYGSKSNVPDYMIRGGVRYRIFSDHLGSPRLIVSSGGQIVERLDYDEFGNIIQDTNPGFQPFGFAGGLYDQHTKLTHFGAREYSAEIGRWILKDQILFWGRDSNIYLYVMNDPTNLRDSNGLSFPLEHGLSTFFNESFINSFSESFVSAFGSAIYDFLGTQGIDSLSANGHAMAGKQNGVYQDPNQAREGTKAWINLLWDLAKNAKCRGDWVSAAFFIGFLDHAIQDSWASGHNYDEWHGGIPSLPHMWGDLPPHFEPYLK